MVWLDPLVLTSIFALPVSAISFAVVHATRAARRNRADRCGNCEGPLYAPGALAGPSLVQGHLICEPCAAKERRRLKGGLIAAGSITAVTVLALAAVALWAPDQLGAHPWIPVLVTSLEYPALFAGAIAWMKRANRRAAQRLGVPPDLALAASAHRPLGLPAGSAEPPVRG